MSHATIFCWPQFAGIKVHVAMSNSRNGHDACQFKGARAIERVGRKGGKQAAGRQREMVICRKEMQGKCRGRKEKRKEGRK